MEFSERPCERLLICIHRVFQGLHIYGASFDFEDISAILQLTKFSYHAHRWTPYN